MLFKNSDSKGVCVWYVMFSVLFFSQCNSKIQTNNTFIITKKNWLTFQNCKQFIEKGGYVGEKGNFCAVSSITIIIRTKITTTKNVIENLRKYKDKIHLLYFLYLTKCIGWVCSGFHLNKLVSCNEVGYLLCDMLLPTY